jgi:hypothetical protein
MFRALLNRVNPKGQGRLFFSKDATPFLPNTKRFHQTQVSPSTPSPSPSPSPSINPTTGKTTTKTTAATKTTSEAAIPIIDFSSFLADGAKASSKQKEIAQKMIEAFTKVHHHSCHADKNTLYEVACMCRSRVSIVYIIQM